MSTRFGESSMSENYAKIPEGWTTALTGQRGIGDQDNNKFYDTTVLHNGQPSVRVKCIPGIEPEASTRWVQVNPGDLILFKMWIKTEPSTVGDNSIFAGPCIDVDLYGDSGRICGITSPTGKMYDPRTESWPDDNNFNRVNWGKDWMFTEQKFVVPQEAIADGFGSGAPAGTLVKPTGMICGIWAIREKPEEGANYWFSEAELYVNPGSPPPVYTCPQCQATFSSQAELDAHIASVHPPTPPPTYQEWIVTRTEPPPTQEWKITVQPGQPGRISGWM